MDRCHYGVQGHSSCFASTSAKELRIEATLLNESMRLRVKEGKRQWERGREKRRGRELSSQVAYTSSLSSLTVPLTAIMYFFASVDDFPHAFAKCRDSISLTAPSVLPTSSPYAVTWSKNGCIKVLYKIFNLVIYVLCTINFYFYIFKFFASSLPLGFEFLFCSSVLGFSRSLLSWVLKSFYLWIFGFTYIDTLEMCRK